MQTTLPANHGNDYASYSVDDLIAKAGEARRARRAYLNAQRKKASASEIQALKAVYDLASRRLQEVMNTKSYAVPNPAWKDATHEVKFWHGDQDFSYRSDLTNFALDAYTKQKDQRFMYNLVKQLVAACGGCVAINEALFNTPIDGELERVVTNHPDGSVATTLRLKSYQPKEPPPPSTVEEAPEGYYTKSKAQTQPSPDSKSPASDSPSHGS